MSLQIFLKKTSIICLCLIINHAKSQPEENLIIPSHIKNQKDLAKYQVIEYLKSLPFESIQCGLYLTKLTKYHKLLRDHGPEIFQQAFKFNDHKRLPLTEHQFPFDNNRVGDVCERNFGFCHGYTSSLTLWNRLAFFDPDNISSAIVPKEVGSDEWFNFYRLLIDELMIRRRPIIIPNFHHLYEFVDSHPRITRYIKELIALEWAKRNINFSSYFKVLNGIYNTFTTTEALELHQKLSFRINKLKINPIVWIASRSPGEKSYLNINNEAGIHNMQAYKITPIDKDGFYKIYFWDIYNANDATQASRVYNIATKATDSNNNAIISYENNDSYPFIFLDKNLEDVSFSFADADTVPFDDINIGEHALKLLEFYNKNPKFTAYLEQQHEYYSKNARPKFRSPVKENPKDPFQIILKDGNVWNVPTKYQYYTGDLWIEKDQIQELEPLIQESLDIITNKTWRSGAKIARHKFQKPLPFSYKNAEGKTNLFFFEIQWFNFKGEFIPNDDFYCKAPYQLIQAIKEYTLFWPIKKPLNFKFFSKQYNRFKTFIDDDGKMIWKIPSEFLSDNGLIIPKNLEKYVPAKVISFLKRNNFWPVSKPININYLTIQSRTINYAKGKKFITPFAWFSNTSDKILINKERFNELPDELKIFVAGFGNKELMKNVSLSFNLLRSSLVQHNDEILVFPREWINYITSIYYNSEYDENVEHKRPNSITLKKDELSSIPPWYHKHLVGEAGTWPPSAKNLTFSAYGLNVTLKDKTTYDFPLTWINEKYFINVPQSESHILPEKVREEIFEVGPYKWPIKNQVIDIGSIQLPPVILNNGADWHWPREWMSGHYDQIILPKSDKLLNQMMPKEIQDKIKNAYGGQYPEDRKISVWNVL